jgi:hypothetical protein
MLFDMSKKSDKPCQVQIYLLAKSFHEKTTFLMQCVKKTKSGAIKKALQETLLFLHMIHKISVFHET